MSRQLAAFDDFRGLRSYHHSDTAHLPKTGRPDQVPTNAPASTGPLGCVAMAEKWFCAAGLGRLKTAPKLTPDASTSGPRLGVEIQRQGLSLRRNTSWFRTWFKNSARPTHLRASPETHCNSLMPHSDFSGVNLAREPKRVHTIVNAARMKCAHECVAWVRRMGACATICPSFLAL
jgi:hypothetical protein